MSSKIDTKPDNPISETIAPSPAPKRRFIKSPLPILFCGVAIGALSVSALGTKQSDAVAASYSLSSGSTSSDNATENVLPFTAGANIAAKASATQRIPQLFTNDAGTLSFANLVEKISPAVVSVLVEREVQTSRRPRNIPPGFERFFNLPTQPDGEQGSGDPFQDDGVRRAEAQGSGFFIDDKGHIVTNHHVIADAVSVKISLADGTEIDAEIIGSDEVTDLAVLKIKDNVKQPFVSFAPDSNLRVGDWVVAVGNPFGLGGTVTTGIVSAIGGRNREQQYLDLIQIDAAINSGNSGGPTFDLSGNVIGVNVAIYSPNGGSVGIGLAIPAATAKQTVAQLIEKGSVTRGWLGIALAPVSQDIADALDLKDTNGVLVNEVIAGTPAANGGVQDSDVITQVDGVEVKGPNDLSRRIANYPPGRKVKLRLIRDGATKNLTVTLGERNDDPQVAQITPEIEEETSAETLGVRVSNLTAETRERFRIPQDAEGVVVTGVKPNSPAQRAGLQPGVVILEVANQKISSPSELEKQLEKAKKAKKSTALLRLQRGSVKQYGALRLDDE